MSPMAQHQSLVKESLFQFITKNMPNADLSVIDDIVLDYVISMIANVSNEPCFEVEAFIEMMSGYIPAFADVDPGAVCDWLMQLESDVSRKETDCISNHDDSAASDKSDKVSLTLLSLSEMLPSITTTKNNRSHSNSESSEGEARECGRGRRVESLPLEEYAEQCRALSEMFPNTPHMEIKHCISIALGDVERAAATLLHRREHGQALATPLPAAAPRPACDDSELKNRIIARYSYVDKNSETKEHRPLAPKIEPKKMVRYRDNKIVSLKGERYTEVPKSGVDEEHLKKPKKQHCP